MYRAPRTSTASAASDTHAGRGRAVADPGRTGVSSAVERPHLKQMIALSEISVPQ
jgi:hypothetical protein